MSLRPVPSPTVSPRSKKTGAIDILVNNAGMQFRSPLEDVPIERWEQLLATNVSSVFYVAQAVARHMIKRGEGKIINIASRAERGRTSRTLHPIRRPRAQCAT